MVDDTNIMTIRLSFDTNLHPHFKKFTEKDRNLYEQLREIFTWCAIYGYKNNKREPLLERLGTTFVRFDVFTKDQQLLLQNIAVGEESSFKILSEKYKNNEKYKLFINIIEEYSTGGMKLLLEKIDESQSKDPYLVMQKITENNFEIND